MAKLPAMSSTLLAFDTSTEVMSVALLSPHGAVTSNSDGGAAASATLLPRIRALLDEHGISITQLDAIAFGCGPGAFTGLRTACSVAQGLAFGADVPVIAVDSLLIVAEEARVADAQGTTDTVADIGVVNDARMGEVYAARYRWSHGRWEVLQAAALWAPDTLCAHWLAQRPAALAGSGLSLMPLMPLMPPAFAGVMPEPDRAAALLRLAAMMYAEGAATHAAQALPVYLRDKVALTTLERHARAAALEAGH